MKKHIIRILIRTAAYYTVITALFSLIILLVYAEVEGGANLSALRMFLFLPFSLMFAVANTLFEVEKITPPLCWTLHCILTVAGAFICLILPMDSSGSSRLVGGVIILVCYLIVAVIVSLFRRRLNRTITESRKYSKM